MRKENVPFYKVKLINIPKMIITGSDGAETRVARGIYFVLLRYLFNYSLAYITWKCTNNKTTLGKSPNFSKYG